MRRILVTASIVLAVSAQAHAGSVISHKTGARASGILDRYVARFQAYINDLEARGARVLFMGGYRKGYCSPRHEHSCGKAMDVCQTSRDRVDPRCHLPSRATLAEIARQHGLFEGGQWCHGDLGHAQVDVTAPSCSSRSFAARKRIRLAAHRR